MKIAHTTFLCGLAAVSLLTACGSNNYPPPTATVYTNVPYHEVTYGVVESIQLVQVVPPPGTAAAVTPDGVAVVARSTYQVGVRLSQGGYQVFTQDNASELRVGDQVRIENGHLHHA